MGAGRVTGGIGGRNCSLVKGCFVRALDAWNPITNNLVMVSLTVMQKKLFFF